MLIVCLLQECGGCVETAVACFFSTQQHERTSPQAQLCDILDNAISRAQVCRFLLSLWQLSKRPLHRLCGEGS